MSFRKLLPVLALTTLAAPALANDLKPGLWESTKYLEGEGLPAELTEKKTVKQCLSADETSDIAALMEQKWNEINCQDIDIQRNGKVIEGQAACKMGPRTTQVETTVTLHSDEHYTMKTVMTNEGQAIAHAERKWLQADCAN